MDTTKAQSSDNNIFSHYILASKAIQFFSHMDKTPDVFGQVTCDANGTKRQVKTLTCMKTAALA